MEGVNPLPEILKVLSEDVELVGNIKTLVDYLRISPTNVIPFMHLYELGQKGPVDLMREVLAEWIKIQGEAATLVELRRILREAEFVACAENLEKLEVKYPGCIKIQQVNSAENDWSQMDSSNLINYGVKNVVLNFMGRDKEFTKLQEYFNSPESCRMVILSGLGGIGKTELAKKFTLSISESQIAKSWLAGESTQSLLNSTTQFCHHLHLSATGSDGQPLGIQKMLQNAFTRIKSRTAYSRWLVIIDNVDEIHPEFETSLETLLDFGPFVFLLVTSRRRDIHAGEMLELSELKLADSVKFVKKTLQITVPSSEQAIIEFCGQLENFPLALSQAVAYIKQQRRQSLAGKAYGVQNYLGELSKKETLGLDKDLKFVEYPKATLKVWNLTLDKIEKNHRAEGRIALNLLNIMSFIDPDNIQIPCLQKLYKRFHTIEEITFDQINSCLIILLQYSLISSCNSVIRIHRLLQLALRERMTSKSTQDNQTWAANLLKSFWTHFDRTEWSRVEMANILQIWKHSSSHPALHELLASKCIFLSGNLYTSGMVKESYDFATECCKFLLDLYGPDNKKYLLMEKELAIAMRQNGNKSSLHKFTFLYEKLKKLCGEDDWHTLNAGHWIAMVLLDLERYEESLEWGWKVLQSKIRIYGEENESTMLTKHNVAIALRDSGKKR